MVFHHIFYQTLVFYHIFFTPWFLTHILKIFVTHIFVTHILKIFARLVRSRDKILIFATWWRKKLKKRPGPVYGPRTFFELFGHWVAKNWNFFPGSNKTNPGLSSDYFFIPLRGRDGIFKFSWSFYIHIEPRICAQRVTMGTTFRKIWQFYHSNNAVKKQEFKGKERFLRD